MSREADRAALVARQIAWLGANCECEELDGAKKTMGGEHPLVAIKRLAHWEVEDDIGMLRTRLACISAQADKVTAAPPAPADRAALVARLRQHAHDLDAAYRAPEDSRPARACGPFA